MYLKLWSSAFEESEKGLLSLLLEICSKVLHLSITHFFFWVMGHIGPLTWNRRGSIPYDLVRRVTGILRKMFFQKLKSVFGVVQIKVRIPLVFVAM